MRWIALCTLYWNFPCEAFCKLWEFLCKLLKDFPVADGCRKFLRGSTGVADKAFQIKCLRNLQDLRRSKIEKFVRFCLQRCEVEWHWRRDYLLFFLCFCLSCLAFKFQELSKLFFLQDIFRESDENLPALCILDNEEDLPVRSWLEFLYRFLFLSKNLKSRALHSSDAQLAENSSSFYRMHECSAQRDTKHEIHEVPSLTGKSLAPVYVSCCFFVCTL